MKNLFLLLTFVFLLLASCSSSKKSSGIFEGYYSYMADANMFVSCDKTIRMPVEMKGEYLTLEKKYLKMSDGNGENVYVRLKGKIKKVPAMEGDEKVDAIMITEVLEIDKNKKCQ